MASLSTPSARSLPRWWRQFVVSSRRANVFLWLEVLAGVALLVALGSTWLAYAGWSSSDEILPSLQVSILLVATLIPAVALLVLFGRRLALKRAAGSTARLHVRLVFFFSLISAVPTLLVAGFAAFLFQSGINFWFSEDSRGLIENSRQLAQEYYDQNQRAVAEETVAMAGDMRTILERVPIIEEGFADLYFVQARAREITESAVLQLVDDRTFRTAAIMNLTEPRQALSFSTGALPRLMEGEFVVVQGSADRISALAAIDRENGIYLFNARSTEENSFNSWERAQAISAGYSDLTSNARSVQLQFNVALVAISLLLVSLAVWFALRLADRQVEPLTDLVGAARKVGQGNFALRVEGRTGADEIGLLNRAFNRMTAQLEKQTDALVSANRQIDDRRAFMEAVLESVTAGVISVDTDARVLLMNSTAQALLGKGDFGDLVGQPLSELSPEFSAMIAGEQERSIISHGQDGDLRTLAVKIAPGKNGHVITFEDITRQLVDQRQAAWSDVARRIAHEIKNPLTPIQLATERLKRRYRKQIDADGELFDELTSTIVRQVGDLRKMVDEFSSFARLPKPNFRSEDAVDLVRQALFLQEVGNPTVRFDLDFSTLEQQTLHCDRHQVGQAMTNVLKNAVEAVETRAKDAEPDFKGTIAVTMLDEDGHLAIAVEDNGIGLPQERDRIAEPYMTTREKGTGLGLAIVNKIVDEHGGDMTFSSSESGGTRVVLRFAWDPQVADGEANS